MSCLSQEVLCSWGLLHILQVMHMQSLVKYSDTNWTSKFRKKQDLFTEHAQTDQEIHYKSTQNIFMHLSSTEAWCPNYCLIASLIKDKDSVITLH